MSPYVVITPVRDEEQYLPMTIESMVSQTILPQEWVIVNDGSTDQTGRIIDEASQKYPWIRGVHRTDRGYRKWGGGIIEAFYAGFDSLKTQTWEFMSKLDGDLSFEPDYFERAIGKFNANPKIGIGGGVLYVEKDGRKTLEKHPTFHVRGGTKIFRRSCWDAIGGLWVGPGSDTVDEVKANMLGWTTMSFFDLQMKHHRPTGVSWGRWTSVAKVGHIEYVYGSHPIYLLAKSLARMVRRPYVLGSLAMLYGYGKASVLRAPRVNDPELIRYLRRQQLNRMMGRETIWK